MRAWSYLFAAIVCELIGTSSIKFLAGEPVFIKYGVMYGFIGLSYYCLSLTVRKVPVGVAYALWEGIGIVLITIIGVTFLHEHLSFYKASGLGLIIIGIVLIKSGTKSTASKPIKQVSQIREVCHE